MKEALCEMNPVFSLIEVLMVAGMLGRIISLEKENKALKEAVCEINPKAKICKNLTKF